MKRIALVLAWFLACAAAAPAADTVIAASPRIASRALMQDFEWMIDELHICGDAVLPRAPIK